MRITGKLVITGQKEKYSPLQIRLQTVLNEFFDMKNAKARKDYQFYVQK